MPGSSEVNQENPGMIRFPGQERAWEHESLDQTKELSAYGWGRVERVVGIAGCTKQRKPIESIRKSTLWNHQAKFLRAKKTIKDKENRAGELKRGRKERTWVPPKSTNHMQRECPVCPIYCTHLTMVRNCVEGRYLTEEVMSVILEKGFYSTRVWKKWWSVGSRLDCSVAGMPVGTENRQVMPLLLSLSLCRCFAVEWEGLSLQQEESSCKSTSM